jgi:hypothetical protein
VLILPFGIDLDWDIPEWFGYRYTEAELKEWAPKIRHLAGDARDPRAVQ